MIRVYVAGAWTEQHQRARPMMSKLREAGLTISHDWSQAEGDVCACGHGKSSHGPEAAHDGWRSTTSTRCERYLVGILRCPCEQFNGIGTGSDSKLTPEQRRTFAREDLDGVLSADVLWLLAANEKGACGSWVELGVAFGRPLWPIVLVSGPKCRRTIFTELATMFDTDEEALAHVLAMKP
jgi:hypothetical protein